MREDTEHSFWWETLSREGLPETKNHNERTFLLHFIIIVFIFVFFIIGHDSSLFCGLPWRRCQGHVMRDERQQAPWKQSYHPVEAPVEIGIVVVAPIRCVACVSPPTFSQRSLSAYYICYFRQSVLFIIYFCLDLCQANSYGRCLRNSSGPSVMRIFATLASPSLGPD